MPLRTVRRTQEFTLVFLSKTWLSQNNAAVASRRCFAGHAALFVGARPTFLC